MKDFANCNDLITKRREKLFRNSLKPLIKLFVPRLPQAVRFAGRHSADRMLLVFLDLTVIYFAFGAPVGVYEITRGRRSVRTVAAATLHLLLWPFFAALSLQRSLVEVRKVAPSLDQQVDALRREIEQERLDEAADTVVAEFRDIFARYVGLTMAFHDSNERSVSADFLAISGRMRSDLAAVCLERRNRRRLEFHLVQARNDLHDILDKIEAPETYTSRLAGLVNDPDVMPG